MRRFFCSICKKVKRVQKWPKNVENRDSGVVTDRIGTCNHHEGRFERAQLGNRFNQTTTGAR